MNNEKANKKNKKNPQAASFFCAWACGFIFVKKMKFLNFGKLSLLNKR